MNPKTAKYVLKGVSEVTTCDQKQEMMSKFQAVREVNEVKDTDLKKITTIRQALLNFQAEITNFKTTLDDFEFQFKKFKMSLWFFLFCFIATAAVIFCLVP